MFNEIGACSGIVSRRPVLKPQERSKIYWEKREERRYNELNYKYKNDLPMTDQEKFELFLRNLSYHIQDMRENGPCYMA